MWSQLERCIFLLSYEVLTAESWQLQGRKDKVACPIACNLTQYIYFCYVYLRALNAENSEYC